MLPVIRKIENSADFDWIEPIEKLVFVEPFPKEVYILDFMEHPYSEYYKLLVNEVPIGYIGLWVIFQDVQITTIAIDPRYQHLGYGQILLDYVIQSIKERGCVNITLEVRVSNEKAIQFYTKNHFLKVAVRKRYYENGEDAYLMKLDL